jgi:2-haloacid dehalogenase
MSSIKNIIFDLGGVLIDWNPHYMYKKIIPDLEKREWFFNNICTFSWNEEQDGGRLIKDANEILIAQYPEYKDLIEAYYDRWEEMLNGPIEETVEIFRTLKHSNLHKFYALTNWSAETFPRALELFDFLHWFDGRLVSGEENTRKPYKEIYELIIARYNLNPTETLFIDDNLRNINAANELGFKTIHFINPSLLASSLKTLGLLESF